MKTLYDDFDTYEEYVSVRKHDICRRIRETTKEFGKIPSEAVIVGFDDLGDWVSDIKYLQVLTIGKYTLGGLGKDHAKLVQFFEDCDV